MIMDKIIFWLFVICTFPLSIVFLILILDEDEKKTPISHNAKSIKKLNEYLLNNGYDLLD